MEAFPSTSRGSRRAFIAAGLGGIAATAAHALGRPLPARAGHEAGDIALHLGEQNSAEAETMLSANLPEGSPGDPIALAVHINKGRGLNGGASIGVGVWGVSHDGDQDHPHVGVEGVAQNNGIGVRGQSKGPFGTPGGSGPGVEGESSTGAGVHGSSESGAGVEGNSDQGNGVAGFGPHGAGVTGNSDDGVGISGQSEDGIGVVARSTRSTALQVVGPAEFSTAGSATVPQGANSVFVVNDAVTEVSHITLTLVSSPGPRMLRWVQRQSVPTKGFTVHFSGGSPAARPETDFTYLIVEPGK